MRNVNAPVQGLRPSAEYLNINQVESTAAMRSNGATVTLRTAAGRWFTGMAELPRGWRLGGVVGLASWTAAGSTPRATWS